MTIVIFDIDGTLADITHRLSHVRHGNKNWKAFNESVHLDTPIQQVAALCRFLGKKQDYRILLVSGRGEEIRETTQGWLSQHYIKFDRLYMRPAKDYRKDFIIKREVLDQIRADYPNEEIAFVVDDRTSVVKMWREAGLICLQCAEWEEDALPFKPAHKGLLTLMVGPSGAGKSSWLRNELVASSIPPYITSQASIVSSDALRQEFCGDFRDQSKNTQVFSALNAIVKARIENGLPAVVDATNIKRADRMSIITQSGADKVRYIIIDRPLEQKQATAGWRGELPFDLVAKHHSTFFSQLKDILRGDDLPNVEVIDLRKLS